jgi:hypothetical protein
VKVTRQVRLHRLLPLSGGQHLFVVAVGPRHAPPGGGDVVEVVLLHLWQGQPVERVEVEILLRGVEGQVRPGEADGEEEGFVVFLFQKLAPGRDLVVAHVPSDSVTGPTS